MKRKIDQIKESVLEIQLTGQIFNSRKTNGEKDETTPPSSKKDSKGQVIFFKKVFEQRKAMLEEERNELDSSKIDNKELLETVEKLKADKGKDEKKIKSLEKELEDIRTEVQDTTGFILELKKDKTALEENLKTAEREKDDSAENLASASAQNEELSIKLTSLEQVKATKDDTTAGTSEGKDGFSMWKSRKWCNKGENCCFGPENCGYRHAKVILYI